MKFLKRKNFIISILFFVFAVISVVLIIKFRKKTDNDEKETVVNVGSYDILVYNTEPKFSEVFNKISDEYSNSSGIVVAFSDNNSDVLSNFLNNPPDIFMIKNFDEFRVQQQYENIFDFQNSSETTFKEVMEKIPDSIKLKSNVINNCGLPLTLRGFGLAVNQDLLSSIFGEESYKNVVNDLMSCSYSDFKKFVENIKFNSTTLNGNEYKINQNAIKSLDSIFSFHIETPFGHLLNNALSEAFPTSSELMMSNNVEKLSGKISKWMQMVDLLSSHSDPSRGSSFLNVEINSKSNAIKKFSDGKSLFLVAEDSDYEEIKKQNVEASKNLIFIPLKAPFETENANTKLTVYCPYYFVINSKSEKLKIAQDFLTWLISSPTPQKYLIENLNFVPYNVYDMETIENPLGRSTLTYFQCNNVLEPIFQGANNNWISTISQYLQRIYLPLRKWHESYYKSFENYCIKRWTNS